LCWVFLLFSCLDVCFLLFLLRRNSVFQRRKEAVLRHRFFHYMNTLKNKQRLVKQGASPPLSFHSRALSEVPDAPHAPTAPSPDTPPAR
jgi:hypothetical protein